MKMSYILGSALSAAIIFTAIAVYPVPRRAEAAASPREIVYVDRVVERIIKVPTPQDRVPTLADTTSKEELYCLAQNIYFEARGESHLGQTAVAWVTLNRVHSDLFPNTICKVVWEDSQFSWTADGKSDTPKDAVAWLEAKTVAVEVLETYKTSNDPTEGSLFFHADYSNPYWNKKFDRVVEIDSHVFYKEITG